MERVEVVKDYVEQRKNQEQCAEFHNKYFPVYCAWCAKKGIVNIAYYSTIENSKGGICEKCEEEAMEDIVRILKEKIRNKR